MFVEYINFKEAQNVFHLMYWYRINLLGWIFKSTELFWEKFSKLKQKNYNKGNNKLTIFQ